MTTFKSPNSPSDDGYKALYKTFKWGPTLPNPFAIPSSADPRGYFKSGYLPSEVFSYRISLRSISSGTTGNPIESSSFIGSPLGGGILSSSASALAQTSLGVAICRFDASFSIVLTEGSDVIDLPTQGLTKEGNEIILPDKVLRLIHAGVTKLIPEGDTKGAAYWSSVAVHGSLAGNIAESIKLNDATKDLISVYSKGNSLLQSDTGSNRITVKGATQEAPIPPCNFVSYVSSKKPIFRDVVSMRGTAFAFALTYSALPGSLYLNNVKRFCYVNKETDEKKTPRMGWRLSESFMFEDASNKATPVTPEGLNSEQKKLFNYAESIKWYAYNVNTETSSPINVAIAKMKMDPSSTHYDTLFKAVILEQDSSGIGYGAGIADYDSVELGPLPAATGSLSPPDSVYANYFYTSPIFKIKLSNSTKIGQEYYISTVGGIDSFSILTKSSVSTGMSILHDPATKLSMFTEPSETGGLERMFDDFAWISGGALPKSSSINFQLGEHPFRSKGQNILIPKPKKLNSIDDKHWATHVTVKLTGPSDDSCKIYTYTDAANEEANKKNPIVEMSSGIWAESNKEVTIGIPATRSSSNNSYCSVVASGGGIESITNTFGVATGDIILEAQTGNKTDTSDQSEFQASNIPQLKFPIKVNNISNTVDKLSGLQILAYETENRIDLATRTTYKDPFSIIRDVNLRISEAGDVNIQNLPSCTNPSIMMDTANRMILLFYMYKSTLLMKSIPIETFVSVKSTYDIYNMYNLESEKKIIKAIHSMYPSVVCAPNSYKVGKDISLGKVRIQTESSSPNDNTVGNSEIDQYCIMKDKSGYLYVFIQSSGKIIVRTSSNSGSTWSNVISKSFSFFPRIDSKTVDEGIYLSSPFVLYDDALDMVNIFYVLENSLMHLPISSSCLRYSDKTTAEAGTLSYISPRLIFGKTTKNMTDRKIVNALNLKDGEKIETGVLNQKIAGIVINEGYYRIFLKDTNSKTVSLISSDAGKSWYQDSYFSYAITTTRS